MNLRDKLREILPGILPRHPQNALKGKELIARVRTVLGEDYSDGTLLSQFSALTFEEGSRLTRIPGGQGYYLRSEGEDDTSLKNFFTTPASVADSPLHRAIALASRMYDTEGLSVFVYPVDEESWNHPDLVAVQWPAGQWEDDGSYTMIDDPRRAASFRAVCVCAEPSGVSCRRHFFRTLACGQWAQEAELLIIGMPDETEQYALNRLAGRFGVGIRCIDSLSDFLPRADVMLRMNRREASDTVHALPCTTAAHPRHWNIPPQAAAEMPDVAPVQEWATYCVQRGHVEAYERRVAID